MKNCEPEAGSAATGQILESAKKLKAGIPVAKADAESPSLEAAREAAKDAVISAWDRVGQLLQSAHGGQSDFVDIAVLIAQAAWNVSVDVVGAETSRDVFEVVMNETPAAGRLPLNQ